jgi:hypothetical protein
MMVSKRLDRRSTSFSLRCRPGLESLERRDLPATTYLVLDFAHDGGGGSLAASFDAARLPGGKYPRFLDMDGNNRVNGQDVTIAARAIANRVARHFRAYKALGVHVIHGDALANTDFAARRLVDAMRKPDVHVAALYFGGYRGRVLGVAPLARPGENVEGFGRVFSSGHAFLYRQRALQGRRVIKQDFINSVAATASHELGHMMGLRHVRGPSYHLMKELIRDSYRSFFPNKAFRTIGGPAQNAHQELRRSFRGEPARVTFATEWHRHHDSSITQAHDHVFAGLAGGAGVAGAGSKG